MRKIITSLFLCVLLSMSAQNQAPEATVTSGTLTVTATVAYSSPYYYAVWIKNSGGTYVRTLMMYGQNSSYYKDMVHWNSESATDKTNATTGATRSSSSTYAATWDGKDKTKTTTLDDGTYTVSIEMSSESYGTNSKYITTTFTKGTSAQTVTPTAVSPVSGISIKWVPSGTGVNDVHLESQYQVYPNPTRSTVFVNGPDVRSVTIYNLAGKQLLKAVVPNLNLNKLPAGTYLAEIVTGHGTLTKKIVKY